MSCEVQKSKIFLSYTFKKLKKKLLEYTIYKSMKFLKSV